MTARLAALAATLLVTLWPDTAEAYTWMIRHGYGGCTTCHADPSGGETLTAYGRIQGDLLLRMRYGKDSVSAAASETKSADFDSFDSFDAQAGGEANAGEAAPASAPESSEGASPTAGFLWGLVELPEWLLLGGSYRHMNVIKPDSEDDKFSTFPMQADLYGQLQLGRVRVAGDIGVIKVEPNSPHGRAAQITTSQGDDMNLVSRTHWIGVDVTPDVLVRAGRINLPFGVRIPEHVMWAREATRTDRDSDQQHGVSVSFQGDWLRGEIMGIAGNFQINPDRFRERGYSLYLEALASDWAALGISSLVTRAEEDRLLLNGDVMTRQAHGGFARLAPLSQLALLIEANGLLRSSNKPGYVAFAQADYEVVQGLHLMLTGEALDEGKPRDQPGLDAVTGQGKPRFGGWASVDWFFLPHLEMRLDGLKRQDEPFTLLAQLHAYL
ncbi:MAG TPA: hypothetical protein VI072_33255 [Polyangiaceae bacterium]